jgi:hypothetical protein
MIGAIVKLVKMVYNLKLSSHFIKAINKLDPNPDVTLKEKIEQYYDTREHIVKVFGQCGWTNEKVDELLLIKYSPRT